MTSRALAWRTISARPARTALAVTGVTVIGALLFTMLLLSRGLLLSFRDLLDTAGYDVRVVSNDGMALARTPIAHAAELVDALAKLPEVREAALVRRERAVALVPGRGPLGIILIGVSPGAERHVWHLVSGNGLSAPVGSVRLKPDTTVAGATVAGATVAGATVAGATVAGAIVAGSPDSTADRANDPPPLVVSDLLANELGVRPGSTLRLRVLMAGAPSALPAFAFHVVGIAAFGLEPGDEFIASTTLAAFSRAQAQGTNDDAEVVLIASRPEFGAVAAVDAVTRLRSDVSAYSNEQIVAQFNQNGFAYFRQISIVLSSITLAFAFLLIATVLSVSVNQRLSEVAALRALGLARQRIAAILLWESAWLVGVGGLLSIPVGGLLAFELDRILRTMPGVPERIHFFVFETRALVLQIALLTATAIGAAVYPIWIAVRLPIAATLRRETVS